MNNNKQQQHISCDKCGSSDALTDYGDHTYCFSCSTRKNNYNLSNEVQFAAGSPTGLSKSKVDSVSLTPVRLDKCVDLKDRGLTKATSSFYNVWVNDKQEQVYPYFDLTGKVHLANKFRTAGQKGFLVQGNISKTGLFGQQLFPGGSAKQITIVEGELDALSAFQMFGSKWPVVSVKNAATARKDVADNFEYLNSFDTVVICFDADKEHKRDDGTVFLPGQEAAQKVAAMFELGKVRVLTLRDAKDASDYLVAGWQDKFVREWWAAPVWTPLGLKLAKNCWEEVRVLPDYDTVPYPWEGLNQLTYGIRLSELVTITAHPKVGKTSVVKEIVFRILNEILEHKDDNRGIGLMMLEETNRDTLLGLMSLTANKPLHLPDVRSQVDEEELKKYFDETYKDEKVILWHHFGSNEIGKVLDYIRYMHNLGCKYIVLDHLSIIVSDQSGDERKQLDEIATKIKQMCIELNISVICIIHQNRKGEIRGTMGVEQLSNIVIKLYRDIKNRDDEVANTLEVVVEANRFCGRCGLASLLKYDGETGRLTELPNEAREAYKNKESKIKEEDKDW